MAKKSDNAKTLNVTIREEDCFDHLSIYKNEIYPLIEEIKQICMVNKIPIFISVAVANSKEKTDYRNECVMAFTERHLQDNRIVKMLLALNNFKFDLPNDVRSAVYKVLDYCDNVEAAQGSTLRDMHLTDDIFDMINLICSGASVALGEQANDDFADEEENLIIPKLYIDDTIGEDDDK